jgi:OFA family oxalate/formate antiporter-like MFS transporter
VPTYPSANSHDATTHYHPGPTRPTGQMVVDPPGVLILLCLGSVYSWSIFRTPLERELGINATESLLPYTVVLVFYAALMPIAGFYSHF